ncbi:MAG: leucine-rich repeat domain-containing protein [Clostridia bacterium]|nr:leucine-rich repeat domain-containing protein [Clostridia bacterium]
MKKKLFLFAVMMIAVISIFIFSASAASLSNFVDVKITLVDGTETTAYLNKGSTWNGYQGYDRVSLYKSYEDSSQTYDWSEVRIFDMRESQIHTFDGATLTPTGTYPQTLLGYPANNPVNITHVYYPQGSVIIASNSFNGSRGWDSIEYLWIPKSVQIISNDICNGATTLEMVEFEAGSQCHTIQDQAFTGCTSLSSINLEDTALVTLGFEGNSTTSGASGVFRSCTSLTTVKFPETLEAIGYNCFFRSGLSGKITLPNSVTNAYPGAFLATKIETLVLGDGPIEIGFNLIGAYGNENGEYLKEIYIPAGATISSNGTQSPWYKCTNTVTFYVVGEIGEDCSVTVSALKTNYDGNHMLIITEEEAKTAEEGSYSGVIVLGYNKCDAFYNGNHIENEDNDCTTDNLCKNCKRLETEAISHTNDVEIVYENGFASVGKRIEGCSNPNCTVIDKVSEAGAIFSALGYSTSPTKDSISGGYKINTTAYEAYLENGNALKYGIIIVNPSSFEAGVELMSDGKLNSSKGIQLEMNSPKYSTINCFIHNFDSETLSLQLVMTLYMIDGSGNVTYLQADSIYTSTTKIGTKTFDTISLQGIIGTEQTALLPTNGDEE